MKVLLVEDNLKLSSLIKEILSSEGYLVDTAHDGEVGERMVMDSGYDLILLDIMLPKKDGIAVCESLRENGVLTPILMLTAKGEIDDRVLGLDSGADDYMTKPFVMDELLARVRALLRRSVPATHSESVLKFLDLELDITSHKLLKNDKEIPVTLKEFLVIEYCMRNQKRVISRDDILAACWDFAYDAHSNIVDVYIKRLRNKLKDTNELYIKTIRGVGYKME